MESQTFHNSPYDRESPEAAGSIERSPEYNKPLVTDEDTLEKEEPTVFVRPIPENYTIFTRQFYTERHKTPPSMDRYPVETDEFLRARYVGKIEILVESIVNGDVDTLVFLDKSARPLAWMVKEFWPIFAADKPQPKIKFMHFDARHWQAKHPGLVIEDPRAYKNKAIDMSVVPPEEVAILRDTFTMGAGKAARKELGPELPEHEKLGSKILIVDEISLSGTTKDLAASFMKTAFPQSKVESTSFLTIGPAEEEQPIWYSSKLTNMRGIGELSEHSEFLSKPGLFVVNKDFDPKAYLRARQASGDIGLTLEQIEAELAAARAEQAQAMRDQDIRSESEYYQLITEGSSAPPEVMRIPDKASQRLRAEIRKLAIDVRAGKQPIFDGFMRDSSGEFTNNVIYRTLQ